jgi:hypothetical protein
MNNPVVGGQEMHQTKSIVEHAVYSADHTTGCRHKAVNLVEPVEGGMFGLWRMAKRSC